MRAASAASISSADSSALLLQHFQQPLKPEPISMANMVE
jgi:hypothetical protein